MVELYSHSSSNNRVVPANAVNFQKGYDIVWLKKCIFPVVSRVKPRETSLSRIWLYTYRDSTRLEGKDQFAEPVDIRCEASCGANCVALSGAGCGARCGELNEFA